MKKAVLAIVILLNCFCCFSQKTTRIGTYVFPAELKEECSVIIKMPFGKADILQIKGDTASMQNAGYIFLDVVCTDYPTGTSLKELNQRRVDALLKRFPFLKRSHLSHINFFRQMDGAEKEKAETMFHGLSVRYTQKQSVASMKADLESLEDILATVVEKDSLEKDPVQVTAKENRDSILNLVRLKKGQLPKNNIPPKYESKPYDIGATGYDKTKRSPYDSTLILSPKTALKRKMITKAAYKAYEWTNWVTLYFHRIGDTTVVVRKEKASNELTFRDTVKRRQEQIIPDSTVLKILSRVKWKNYSIVEDVTVSMYPYSAQLLLWLKMHSLDSATNDFVFFNDGNEMPDNEKKIGSTGGVYAKECRSFSDVKKLMKETMSKGSGGDRPENDIEALLAGEKEFPQNDFQVLIADNRAPIKDKALIKKLTKPVRVILCGANTYNINSDYLDLARKTNGSVHLMEQDIDNLVQLKEGESLKIGAMSFKIVNGCFVEEGEQDAD